MLWPFKKKIKIIEAAGGQIDSDDHLYRRLTGKPREELTAFEQDRMLEVVSYLYTRNPIARRLTEITKDFIVGEGISFTSDKEDTLEVLTEFWEDSENNWDLTQHIKALEIGLLGEQCYPVFINEIDGSVKMGTLDPSLIESVKTDPENSEKAIEVIVKSDPGITKKLRVIHRDNNPKSKTFGYLTGECFYFAVNKLSHEARGKSDLFPLADWIDGFDNFLFNRLEKSALHSSFVWDVTLEGKSEAEITAWLKTQKTPTPGSLRAHNEKMRWEAVAPDLKAADAQMEAELIKYLIFGGAGIPIHWFAEGGDVNRATASEMALPTLKRLSARQRYFRYMLEYIFRFVIDQAIIHKRLKNTKNNDFKLIFPDISIKDNEKLSNSLQRLTNSLGIATQSGWISNETASNIYANMVGQFGIDIDSSAEMEKIKQEKEYEENKDYLTKTDISKEENKDEQ